MLTIWGRKNSSNVQKVLWCCGELDVPYKRIDAGLAFGKTDEPDYRAKNPNGLVPTIEDDGFVLWESNAILRYLGTKHGGLYPGELEAKADVDRWLDWQLSRLGPATTPAFFNLIRHAPDQRDQNVIDRSAKDSATLMGMLDRHLAGRRFLCGDDLTVADIANGVLAYRWKHLDIERPTLANVDAWYERLTQRSAYQEYVMLTLT